MNLSTIYIISGAASLVLAAFASFAIAYGNFNWIGKIVVIPLVVYVVSALLSFLLQGISCSRVMFSSTLQGNLLFLILIPLMYFLYAPSDAQSLPYLQRIVTSVFDSTWTNEQKSPFAYGYWVFFTTLVLFAFLLPVQTICTKP